MEISHNFCKRIECAVVLKSSFRGFLLFQVILILFFLVHNYFSKESGYLVELYIYQSVIFILRLKFTLVITPGAFGSRHIEGAFQDISCWFGVYNTVRVANKLAV